MNIYTTTEMNRAALIRWREFDGTEWSKWQLIGAGQLKKVLKETLVDKMNANFYESGRDQKLFKYRSGLQFKYISR